MGTTEPPAKPGAAAKAPELVKGNCQDCPYYKDCPRMRGENVCHSLHPASDGTSVERTAEGG